MGVPSTTEKPSASSSGSRRRRDRPSATAVLLDTNALFLPLRSGFPLEAEVDRILPGARLLVADATFRELDRLVERATPSAVGARAFAKRFVRVVAKGEGDDAVVEVATRKRAVVLTADRALQTRLRRRGISVLAPRDRHRLELQPGLPPPAGSARLFSDLIHVLLRKSTTQSLYRSLLRMITAWRTPQMSQTPTTPLPNSSGRSIIRSSSRIVPPRRRCPLSEPGALLNRYRERGVGERISEVVEKTSGHSRRGEEAPVGAPSAREFLET